MTASLIDQYFEDQQKFEKKYGSKVVILQQVGSFFEVQSLNNDEEKIGDVPAIAELLNIQATRKNKSIAENSRSNPMLCGFPLASLTRCLGVLVAAGYTCVVIEQTTPPPNPKREITQIASPGTYTENNDVYESNHLMCFVVRKETRAKEGDIYHMGCSSIDVSTGASTAYEAVDHASDKNYAINEGVRMIKSFNPKEVILYGEVSELIQNKLELGGRIVHILPYCKGSEKISFMNQFLGDFYKDRGCLSPIEYIDMENKFLACVAFVTLIRFVYDHNENSLKKLQRPSVLNEVSSLCLENNAIQQLNILPACSTKIKGTPKSIQSLFDVVGFCSTPMGFRRLRERLCRPLTDADAIEKRYATTQALLQDKEYLKVQENLKAIGDIERLTRKLSTNKTPSTQDIFRIWNGLSGACFLLTELPVNLRDTLDVDHDALLFQATDALAYLENNLEKEALENTAADNTNIFLQNYDATLDDIFKKIKDSKSSLEAYPVLLNQLINSPSSTPVKLEFANVHGYYLSATKKNTEILKKGLKQTPVVVGSETIDIDSLMIATSTSACRMTTTGFKAIAESLISWVEKAKCRTSELFGKFVNELSDKYSDHLNDLCDLLIEIDLFACSAAVADQRRYCRPVIDQSTENDSQSFMMANDIRHPIIECLQTGVRYVPTSISLGVSADCSSEMEDMNGMMLYGCNSAGKSSLMKAVGLCTVLAQAGFYVPATNFRYRPFTSIMTRILGNDDIFKGHSSFATEMSELCGILKRADDKTLVLGDEIANSTESTSGLAIVAAAVDRLSRQNSKFIFATHLHELSKLESVKSLSNVKHFHLEIRYDAALDTLVYDRCLKVGSGSAIYGLEIAKAMGMDDAFLKTAHGIRKQILQLDDQVVSTKQSRYNSRLHKSPCQVCGAPGEHVHHIKEQSEADADGMIGSMHKNDLSNLVNLCASCHDRVHHAQDITISGYIQTTSGRKLDFMKH